METKYNILLKNALNYYYSNENFIDYYGKVPKFRDYTFSYCLDFLKKKNKVNILELGTCRSYVDGRFPGCLEKDTKYWEPDNCEKWDWSAGIFTKYFSDLLEYYNLDFIIDSVDYDPKAINISKNMTNSNNIKYYCMNSENYLNQCNSQMYDLIYIDTGNMDETTQKLHLREAKIIVEKNILKDEGIILIDDVKNPCTNLKKEDINYGKAKYSIPYFLENGYDIIVDEYQIILKKKKMN